MTLFRTWRTMPRDFLRAALAAACALAWSARGELGDPSGLPALERPVLCYAFEHDEGVRVVDDSGTGCHGFRFGAVPTADRFGRANSALHFDGCMDYIKLAGPRLDRFTVCAWVRPGAKRNGCARFFSSGGDACSVGIGSNGIVQVAAPAAGWTDSGVALPEDAWSFLAVASDGTSVCVYVDDALRTNLAPAAALQLDKFGACLAEPLRGSYRGDMDDIRVYGRALGPREVVSLHLGEVSAPAYVNFAVRGNPRRFGCPRRTATEATASVAARRSRTP